MAVEPESAGAAGAVVDESAGPGEVDCCLEQATSASALMHSKIRLRFIGHLTVFRECRRGSFTVPGGTQRTVARGVPLQLRTPCRKCAPGSPGSGEKLFLGGGALLLLGRVLRAALAERALVNLAATAPAISLTHEIRSKSRLLRGAKSTGRAVPAQSARRVAPVSLSHAKAVPRRKGGFRCRWRPAAIQE